MTVAPHPCPTSPAALLAAYRAGDAFYFTSPTGGLLAARPGRPVAVPAGPAVGHPPVGHPGGDHAAGHLAAVADAVDAAQAAAGGRDALVVG
ncbi:MAG TPA: hypothetical protein VFY17_02075, partial [Pilimelia sp.]|nr:hypothetical protein [Pilimelia sp.]